MRVFNNSVTKKQVSLLSFFGGAKQDAGKRPLQKDQEQQQQHLLVDTQASTVAPETCETNASSPRLSTQSSSRCSPNPDAEANNSCEGLLEQDGSPVIFRRKKRIRLFSDDDGEMPEAAANDGEDDMLPGGVEVHSSCTNDASVLRDAADPGNTLRKKFSSETSSSGGCPSGNAYVRNESVSGRGSIKKEDGLFDLDRSAKNLENRETLDTFSVLDLTLDMGNKVWDHLRLKQSELGVNARSSVLQSLSDCESARDKNDVLQESEPERDSSERLQKWVQNLPIMATSRYFREYADVLLLEGAGGSGNGAKTYSFPSWLLLDKIRDKHGHRPDHPAYDSSTLWIPPVDVAKKEAKHSTPAMQQYWDIKRDHFDKIIFFKIGKFYEIFYVDAFIANRISGLRWMGSDEKPHVGFPETSLHQQAQTLVQHGFKVVVVEQMETPKEMDQRHQRLACGRKSGAAALAKTVRRDVCEVFSIGTLLHEAMLPTDSQFLMALVYDERGGSFGFTFADISTCRLWIGGWDSDKRAPCRRPDAKPPRMASLQALRAFLAQIAPAEMVIDQRNIPVEAFKAMKQLPICPHMNALPMDILRDRASFDRFLTFIGRGLSGSPEGARAVTQRNAAIIAELHERQECLLSFTLLCRYLESMLLMEKLLAFARFERYDPLLGEDGSGMSAESPSTGASPSVSQAEASSSSASSFSVTPRLMMDVTALRHLNVLQGVDGGLKGTLLEFVNHTVTPMGHRMLRRWLACPLRAESEINARLDVVDWFLFNRRTLNAFRSRLNKLPDVERLMTKVCTTGLRGLRGAVYFDDVHARHFRQFVELLESLETIQEALMEVVESKSLVGVPRKLHMFCTLASEDGSEASIRGCLPNLKAPIGEIKDCLVKNQESQQWSLKRGVDEAYDVMMDKIDQLTQEIEESLASLLKRFCAEENKGNSSLDSLSSVIRYVHSKFPYEIEVPEHHRFTRFVQKEDPVATNITSSRSGFIRFRTEAVEHHVACLDDLKVQLKDVLYGCQQRLFQKFYQRYYDACLVMLSAVAEMDVLAAFAVLASSGVSETPNGATPSAERVMCRPHLIPVPQLSDNSEGPKPPAVLRLIQSRHPIVAAALPAGAFYVTNDIRLNDVTDALGAQPFFLVTGPNMGGKSTLLRQVCLAVILAQVGCYVPAAECVLTPVDRIFTRLGAYDALLEGKSSFLVEMEETSPAISQSTEYSLAVIDELGRGTSTHDGSAIALAVAEHLALKTKARCLFATHFQLLADELRDVPTVRNVHMGMTIDPDTSSVIFLYTLVPGSCPKSHGIHVARMAGVLDTIVRAAEARAAELLEQASAVHWVLRLKALAAEIIQATRDDKELAASDIPVLWEALFGKYAGLVSSAHPTHLQALTPAPP